MSKFLHVSVFLTVTFLNFIPVKDPDFGWHYRCGVELLRGNPCLSNTFSYFLTNYQAYNPSFIYDLITAVFYNAFGFLGLSFLHALMMTGIFYLFHKLTKHDILVNFLTFFLVSLLSQVVFGLGWRSQILTLTFAILGYYLLESVNRHNSIKYLLLYMALMIVWVNTHIGFIVGLIVYGIYWLETSTFWLLKKKSNAEFFKISAFGILSFLITLFNPFSYRVYLEIWNHLNSPLGRMIAEWVPSPLIFKILIVVIALSVLVRQLMANKFSFFQFALLFAFGLLSFLANRNLPLFFIFSAIFLLQSLPKIKLKFVYDIAVPIFIAILISTLFIRVKNTAKSANSWESFCTKGATNYPCRAIKNYPQLSGNIFAAYEWGGFLIWQRPDLKVFSDGRMPAWKDENGESPYQVYLKIIQTQSGWNEKLRENKTDYLILSRGTFLDLLLQTEQKKFGWSEVYGDQSHRVYKNIL